MLRKLLVPVLLTGVLAGCRSSAPIRITSSPSGAAGTVQCGSRTINVVTPAAASLPRGSSPCILTLAKEGFEETRVPITAVLRGVADSSEPARHELADHDAPFLGPANGGIWSPAGSQLQAPSGVTAERPKSIHLVLQPLQKPKA